MVTNSGEVFSKMEQLRDAKLVNKKMPLQGLELDLASKNC